MSNVIAPPYVQRVCRPGAGDGTTCAFLTMALGTGWQCAKNMPDVKTQIDARLAAGAMNAKGDNCEGWDSDAK